MTEGNTKGLWSQRVSGWIKSTWDSYKRLTDLPSNMEYPLLGKIAYVTLLLMSIFIVVWMITQVDGMYTNVGVHNQYTHIIPDILLCPTHNRNPNREYSGFFDENFVRSRNWSDSILNNFIKSVKFQPKSKPLKGDTLRTWLNLKAPYNTSCVTFTGTHTAYDFEFECTSGQISGKWTWFENRLCLLYDFNVQNREYMQNDMKSWMLTVLSADQRSQSIEQTMLGVDLWFGAIKSDHVQADAFINVFNMDNYGTYTVEIKEITYWPINVITESNDMLIPNCTTHITPFGEDYNPHCTNKTMNNYWQYRKAILKRNNKVIPTTPFAPLQIHFTPEKPLIIKTEMSMDMLQKIELFGGVFGFTTGLSVLQLVAVWSDCMKKYMRKIIIYTLLAVIVFCLAFLCALITYKNIKSLFVDDRFATTFEYNFIDEEVIDGVSVQLAITPRSNQELYSNTSKLTEHFIDHSNLSQIMMIAGLAPLYHFRHERPDSNNSEALLKLKEMVSSQSPPYSLRDYFKIDACQIVKFCRHAMKPIENCCKYAKIDQVIDIRIEPFGLWEILSFDFPDDYKITKGGLNNGIDVFIDKSNFGKRLSIAVYEKYSDRTVDETSIKENVLVAHGSLLHIPINMEKEEHLKYSFLSRCRETDLRCRQSLTMGEEHDTLVINDVLEDAICNCRICRSNYVSALVQHLSLKTCCNWTQTVECLQIKSNKNWQHEIDVVRNVTYRGHDYNYSYYGNNKILIAKHKLTMLNENTKYCSKSVCKKKVIETLTVANRPIEEEQLKKYAGVRLFVDRGLVRTVREVDRFQVIEAIVQALGGVGLFFGVCIVTIFEMVSIMIFGWHGRKQTVKRQWNTVHARLIRSVNVFLTNHKRKITPTIDNDQSNGQVDSVQTSIWKALFLILILAAGVITAIISMYKFYITAVVNNLDHNYNVRVKGNASMPSIVLCVQGNATSEIDKWLKAKTTNCVDETQVGVECFAIFNKTLTMYNYSCKAYDRTGQQILLRNVPQTVDFEITAERNSLSLWIWIGYLPQLSIRTLKQAYNWQLNRDEDMGYDRIEIVTYDYKDNYCFNNTFMSIIQNNENRCINFLYGARPIKTLNAFGFINPLTEVKRKKRQFPPPPMESSLNENSNALQPTSDELFQMMIQNIKPPAGDASIDAAPPTNPFLQNVDKPPTEDASIDAAPPTNPFQQNIDKPPTGDASIDAAPPTNPFLQNVDKPPAGDASTDAAPPINPFPQNIEKPPAGDASIDVGPPTNPFQQNVDKPPAGDTGIPRLPMESSFNENSNAEQPTSDELFQMMIQNIKPPAGDASIDAAPPTNPFLLNADKPPAGEHSIDATPLTNPFLQNADKPLTGDTGIPPPGGSIGKDTAPLTNSGGESGLKDETANDISTVPDVVRLRIIDIHGSVEKLTVINRSSWAISFASLGSFFDAFTGISLLNIVCALIALLTTCRKGVNVQTDDHSDYSPPPKPVYIG